MHPDPLLAMDAFALSQAIHKRDLSAREVMQSFLARIDAAATLASMRW